MASGLSNLLLRRDARPEDNVLDNVDAARRELERLSKSALTPSGGDGRYVRTRADSLIDPGSLGVGAAPANERLRIEVAAETDGSQNAVAIRSIGEHIFERDQLDSGANGTVLGLRRRNMATNEGRGVLRLAVRQVDGQEPAAGLHGNIGWQARKNSGQVNPDDDNGLGWLGMGYQTTPDASGLYESNVELGLTHGDVPLATYLIRANRDYFSIAPDPNNSHTNYQILIGTETENTFGTRGLTIHQRGADDHILSFKNDDVAHGITGVGGADTDTFGHLAKAAATTGGLALRGLSEDTIGLSLSGLATNDVTTKATTSVAYVLINAQKKSGTGFGAAGANANLLAIRNLATTRFIFDAEGDFHYDGALTNYDAYDDAALCRALALELAPPEQVIRSEFDRFVTYRRADLEQAGIVSPSGMINQTRLSQLHNGAIWQHEERLRRLEQIAGIAS